MAIRRAGGIIMVVWAGGAPSRDREGAV